MKTRPVVAAFFVLCCLLLCGLILRRQIAAHPLPPETAQRGGDQIGDAQGDPRFWLNPENWHPAPPRIAAQMQATIQGQISAFNADDGVKAMSYQSRAMHRGAGSPADFMQMIANRYPEFAQSRKVEFGPVWTDKSARFGQAIVTVKGKNGGQMNSKYLLVRESGQYKVANVFAHRQSSRGMPFPHGMGAPGMPPGGMPLP